MGQLKYNFPVYGTQGGGLVRLVDEAYYFVEAPDPIMELNEGDAMPPEWSLGGEAKIYKKKEKRISVGFFTKGSEVIVKTFGSKQVKVDALVKMGPDHYCIRTVNKDSMDEKMNIVGFKVQYFDIRHVTGVVSHIPGKVTYALPYGTFENKSYLDGTTIFEYEGNNKHPSQYCTRDISARLQALVESIVGIDCYVDLVKLKRMFLDSHLGKRTRVGSRTAIFTIFTINKKKLQKFVRRNVNRCLLNAVKSQREQEADYSSDSDDLLGNQIEAEFYREATNEHGFPQTYQQDSDKDIPVCSQCHCIVLPNQGGGTACESCQADFMAECRADYNAGL